MGPMKITPTLILLLNFLLHGDKLQQIFLSGYWHALPAIIYYIGVVSYVDQETRLEKYYDRLVKNNLGRKICEAVLLWVFLSLNFYGWIFVQRLIYRTVRAWLTKSLLQTAAPLAILWQPEPSWRDMSSQNSDNIAFVVALGLSSTIMACCVSSSGGWNKRFRCWMGREDPVADTQWPPMVWPWSRTVGQQLNDHDFNNEEEDEEEDFPHNNSLSWNNIKRTFNVWPTTMDPSEPLLSPQARPSYAPLPDFIPQDTRRDLQEQQLSHLVHEVVQHEVLGCPSESSESSISAIGLGDPGSSVGQRLRRQTPPWAPPPMTSLVSGSATPPLRASPSSRRVSGQSASPQHSRPSSARRTSPQMRSDDCEPPTSLRSGRATEGTRNTGRGRRRRTGSRARSS